MCDTLLSGTSRAVMGFPLWPVQIWSKTTREVKGAVNWLLSEHSRCFFFHFRFTILFRLLFSMYAHLPPSHFFCRWISSHQAVLCSLTSISCITGANKISTLIFWDQTNFRVKKINVWGVFFFICLSRYFFFFSVSIFYPPPYITYTVHSLMVLLERGAFLMCK